MPLRVFSFLWPAKENSTRISSRWESVRMCVFVLVSFLVAIFFRPKWKERRFNIYYSFWPSNKKNKIVQYECLWGKSFVHARRGLGLCVCHTPKRVLFLCQNSSNVEVNGMYIFFALFLCCLEKKRKCRCVYGLTYLNLCVFFFICVCLIIFVLVSQIKNEVYFLC